MIGFASRAWGAMETSSKTMCQTIQTGFILLRRKRMYTGYWQTTNSGTHLRLGTWAQAPWQSD